MVSPPAKPADFFKEKKKQSGKRTLWSAVKSKNHRSEWGGERLPQHIYLPGLKWCYLLKTLACVSPLIYHSALTSMQISKQKETSPAHLPPPPASRPPLRRIGCQLPDVWGEQLHQRGEAKHRWQEKRGEIEAYPPSGISLVSFTPFHS